MQFAFAESECCARDWRAMTSKEIRQWAIEATERDENVENALAIAMLQAQATFEVAAQLAELNEKIDDGGVPIQVVGAAATDLHTLTVAAASLPRRRRY